MIEAKRILKVIHAIKDNSDAIVLAPNTLHAKM